jgi:hypothetical protein
MSTLTTNPQDSLPSLVRRWSDCFGYGCAKCHVCRYLDFIEYAESVCPPGQGIITRDSELEAYLRLGDDARRSLPFEKRKVRND